MWNRAFTGLVVVLPLALAGCVPDSALTAGGPPPGGVIALRLEPCTDLTHAAGYHLGAEATNDFRSVLEATPAFRLDPAGRYRLVCTVSDFVEGPPSVYWTPPAGAATRGKVGARIIDGASGATLAAVRNDGEVPAGGLMTVNVNSFVLRTTVERTVHDLAAWARGEHAAGAAVP